MTNHTEEISYLLPIGEFADRGIKWLLESADNVKGLLEIVAANLVQRLDFDRLEMVNQSFIPDNQDTKNPMWSVWCPSVAKKPMMC